MKKMISCVLSASMLCSSLAGFALTAKAEGVVFKHQNVVGSQTCYSGDDLNEITITEIPDVKQGMRINQPVFRAEGLTANKSYTVKQELKDGTVIKEETLTAPNDTLEFKHARNCEMIEILDGANVVASLGTEPQYVHGVAITRAPMPWQVYQRDESNEAEITIKGLLENGDESVTVEIDGNTETVNAENKAFTYTKTLTVGMHDITVKSGSETVAKYENVAVGDVWVAAGQSNMTDMGAITDGFDPETADPINDNMRIIFPEDTTWHKMSHPAGEGRFFKSGVRTSPVTSFAREIASSENVPVGIVQSSVGGTYTYQWVDGIRSDANSGYLIAALKSCFDKMPSHDVKGILWYQGCNDTDKDSLAYAYKENQGKIFNEMRTFFGENVPIITTQINDANQDSDFDRWSYIKDIQRQNEELYSNVYVVGTSEFELGDTIHNNAASNVKLGKKWANAAENVVYKKTDVNFREPTIDTAEVTDENEITLTFKNTEGLKRAEGTKRIGITNGLYTIQLGDLAKEFTVRNRASRQITGADSGKGTTLTVTKAEIVDKTKVVITTEEELAGVVAVDCMYGKRFTPTLVDAETGDSVLGFYNVIAEYDSVPEVSAARNVELTYTCEDEPCADMDVTIEALGATALNVETVTQTTGADGKVTVSLPDGTYRATTAKKIGEREASSNKFTVSGSNVTQSYTIVKNNETKPAEPIYTFGDSYNEVKEFNTSPLGETARGDTGFKVSTSTSNYNNVVVRDKSGAKSGYYPYGNGLPDNGYYLFLGSGGNSSVAVTLTLPETAEVGKYMKITYAKPYATNNGSANRNSANDMDDKITVGSEVIDLKENCEFDKWYTTIVKLNADVSKLDISLGKWGAAAISSIQILNSADTMELISEDNVSEKYITAEYQTVKYNAKIYNSVTTEMGKPEITARGTVDTAASVTYSVDYDGVTIADDGTLTITPQAQPGTVTITASYNGIEKSIQLTLNALGNADKVEIFGDEVVTSGADAVTKQYSAIPFAENTALPARSTTWTIESDANNTGAHISSGGVLTVPANAGEGIVTIKASLTVAGAQTTENVTDTFNVTVRNSASAKSAVTVKGLLLKNGETDISAAQGIDAVIIDKGVGADADYKIIVKVFDNNNAVIAEKEIPVQDLSDGVQGVKCEDFTFTKAAFAKVYVVADAKSGTSEVTGDRIVTENGKITKVIVTADEAAQNAKLITAQYKSNSLITANITDVPSVTAGENEIAANITAVGGTAVKAFLWADTDKTMKPLSDAVTAIYDNSHIVDGAVISDAILTVQNGEYKNVPLVSDWITGEQSKLGMGKGVLKPQGAPYGVDPALVDVSTQNVKYSYDNNYQGAETDNVLWYKEAAYMAQSGNSNNSIYDMHSVDWEREALPIGNGYMGGMLFGTPDKDQIQFNEETFWAAGYRGVQTAVKSDSVNKNMSEGINGYMSAGNIFVDFGMPKGAAVKNYYRDLNLDDAVAHVRYEYDGVKYSREYLASHPKGVLAFRYTTDQTGALNFTVNPVSMHSGEVTVNDGEITIIGKLKDSEPYSSGGNVAWNQKSDLEYCTKIKVIADDGEITDGYNKVTVNGATGVTILVTAATDYDKDQFELNGDGTVNMDKTPYKSVLGVQAAIDKAESRMNNAAAMSYDALKSEHIKDYKSQFNTVKFSLTDANEVCSTPTDELQASYNSVVSTTAQSDGATKVSYDNAKYAALDKHLEELHYNYARYMMISSSRSDTMPATLQGKWCQSTAEIWGSCYCININMEMNYWFAGGANLLDSGKSLIRWFNSQIPAGKITAKNMYNVTPKSYKYENGQITFTDSAEDKDDVFIMHTKQAIMGTTDMTGSTSIQSAGNTAWLMYNLWDLYQTSGDKDLLENELYPIMRKTANFYTQYLYNNERKTTTDLAKYPDGYYYTTWAGRSPEQGPTEEGIKYDLQLVAGMYDYTIAAAETLNVDADKVAAWKEIRNHLEIPVELGTDGQIKEWAEETTYNTDANGNAIGDPVHRHISHLVGLYPGTLITRDTPDLLAGAKTVLEKRGDASTGWSCSNKFLLWARTLEGDKALELFRYQLAKKTYSNLFDTHDPFQIDGNFGSAAGIMELLMQSQTGTIYILPALPTVWDKGEISGIKSKNGATVSIKWSDNKADEIRITPAFDGDLTIGYDKNNTLTLNGTDVTFNDGKYTITDAKAGTEYVFTSK